MLKKIHYKHKMRAWGFVIAIFFSVGVSAQLDAPVELTWLGSDSPKISTGVSWGVPFKKGQVQAQSNYSLSDPKGNSMLLQSWPLAYWPDGSIKWIGLSTVVDSFAASTLELRASNNVESPQGQVQVIERDESIQINTGVLKCEIPRTGNKIINSLEINDRTISSGGQLVCILQNGPSQEIGKQPDKEKFIGQIDQVIVEQSGPVRSVVKIEGSHVSTSSERSFLPFIIRLYFYSGQQTVKMVHTIIYDGQQNEDFIRGLGVTFDLPLDEESYNRHVRFSGENNGFWSEPIQPMFGRRTLSDQEMYPNQLIGKRMPEREDFTEREKSLLNNWASWNDFKLIQANSDGFTIQKRTNDKIAFINSGAGNRSSGLAFAGDVSGGLAVCIRNFWQSYPSALEIRNARSNNAQLKAWLWSPDGPEMDMRHYDTLSWGHGLNASYEDVQPGFSTPMGVARSSELLLFASANVPSFDTLNALVDEGNDPSLLIASPEYIHDVQVFGAWSLPDKSTKGRRWIEDQLEKAFYYYQQEVDKRKWYGYWDFGDVMHAYDKERHQWRYDIGGYAWDNSELVPNMWLWYSFLRTGSKDIFRMAEAMTRHTSEVDVHHLGRFAGLGSRHNVRHWGDGAKEVRISQAALSRFFYYLTTDERTGDLMRESVEVSNQAIGKLDPLRLILEKSEYPTHARMGPDWLALVGNWMTEWERTGDIKYRDRILTGVNCLSEMPYGLFSGKGAAMGYDPSTYKLYQLNENDIGYSHLSVLMGGPEVAFELTSLLENDTWTQLWLQFCKLYGQPVERIEKEFGQKVKLGDNALWYARLPAFYASKTGKTKWAEKAWNDFLARGSGESENTKFDMKLVTSPAILSPVLEVEGVSTNNTAQWSLNAIELLHLVGDHLPEDHPRFDNINKQNKK